MTSTQQVNTVLVVGRFGSGKSTFLNALAGVHYSFLNGQFVAKLNGTELFPSSMFATGCTVAAVSRKITTFDGRKLNVIDTVGYDDKCNAHSLYNTSNLTEVMNKFDSISGLVIVLNFRDPRLTHGFVEALVCVPKSFKKRVQQNVVLLFTNCSDRNLENARRKQGKKLFADQMTVIRRALGFEESDEVVIPYFCVENEEHQEYDDLARHTIQNLSRLIDCVTEMPELSCKMFKEMRVLSQFARDVREAIQRFFQPSNGSETEAGMSGFEHFLLQCSLRHAEKIPKASLTAFTARDWAEKLYSALQQEVVEKLPGEIYKICEDVHVLLSSSQFQMAIPYKGTVGGTVSKTMIWGGALAIFATAPMTAGFSLLALPACAAVAWLHSRAWSRQDVINRVVMDISNLHARDLCEKCVSQFTSHVDNMVNELQKYFEDLSDVKDNCDSNVSFQN